MELEASSLKCAIKPNRVLDSALKPANWFLKSSVDSLYKRWLHMSEIRKDGSKFCSIFIDSSKLKPREDSERVYRNSLKPCGSAQADLMAHSAFQPRLQPPGPSDNLGYVFLGENVLRGSILVAARHERSALRYSSVADR